MSHTSHYDHILIRYGELGLKGKNKKQFLKTLMRNIRKQIFDDTSIRADVVQIQGRIVLNLDGENPELFIPSLKRVFGIASFSPVVAVAPVEEKIIASAIKEMEKVAATGSSFRVSVRRANKQFPIQSMVFQRMIALKLLETYPQLEPDLTSYDVELSVDIRLDYAYLYVQTIPGLGGLPLGTGGRGMLLLSGGIDSPVAGWLMMRRGVVVEAIHFQSPPYTSKQAEEKVLTLARKMAEYGNCLWVHMVPFTAIQEAIGASCHANIRITIMRRIMLRITEKMASIRHAHGIVTGDNIGQVASQTIESLFAINEVTSVPVFRPLLTYDKQEIIQLSKKIDTYSTSVLPYEDCCTVFVPKEPKTKPKVSECLREEARINALDELIDKAIEEVESIQCGSHTEHVIYHNLFKVKEV